MNWKRQYMTVVAVLLTGACAGGGGSFDAIEVNPEPAPAEKPKVLEQVLEPRQGKEEQGALKAPAMGFAMKAVRRNSAEYDSSGKPLLDGKGEPRQAEALVSLDTKNLLNINHAGLDDRPFLDEMKNDPDNADARSIYHSGAHQSGYGYIRFGHVESPYSNDEILSKNDAAGHTLPYVKRHGNHAYTFYYGTQAAQALPESAQAKYRGEWFFMTDAKQNRNVPGYTYYKGHDGESSSAIRYGIDSSDAQYPAEFSVSFADKKLTGTLGYQSRVEKYRQLYSLSADLNGNRFQGKARSLATTESDEAAQKFFYAHSDFLEGGFYGPKGQELAGKFLSNDNSNFVVFGAKREDSGSTDETANALFDAYYIERPKLINITAADTEDAVAPDNGGSSYDSDDEDDNGGAANADIDDDNGDEHENSGIDSGEEENEGDGSTADKPAVYAARSSADENSEDFSDDSGDEDGREDDGNADADGSDPSEKTVGQSLAAIKQAPLANFGDVMKLRFGDLTLDIEGKQVNAEIQAAFPDALVITDAKKKVHTIVLSKTGSGTAQTINQYAEACCSNLNYLRFGSFRLPEKNGGANVSGLYLQGERTAAADMPQSGQVQYSGTWAGFIQAAKPKWQGGKIASYQGITAASAADMSAKSKSRADFAVDFGSKTLSGNLRGENGSAMLKIDAAIAGSGFSGKAYTDGKLNLDPGSTNGGYLVEIKNAAVEGGFYGKNAAELGGRVFYNSTGDHISEEALKVGAVFGATKQAQ